MALTLQCLRLNAKLTPQAVEWCNSRSGYRCRAIVMCGLCLIEEDEFMTSGARLSQRLRVKKVLV